MEKEIARLQPKNNRGKMDEKMRNMKETEEKEGDPYLRMLA